MFINKNKQVKAKNNNTSPEMKQYKTMFKITMIIKCRLPSIFKTIHVNLQTCFWQCDCFTSCVTTDYIVDRTCAHIDCTFFFISITKLVNSFKSVKCQIADELLQAIKQNLMRNKLKLFILLYSLFLVYCVEFSVSKQLT